MERLTAEQIAKSRIEIKTKSIQSRGRLFAYGYFATFLLFAICSAGSLFAESPQESFQHGNALYADGKFAEAADAYKSARDAGLRHWALEYNLGNAYFKTGQLGRAIAGYERAFRLNSGQRDVLANLRLASERAGDPVVPQSALPALAWRLFFAASINTLTLLTSLLFLSLLGLAGFSLFRRSSVAVPEVWVLLIGSSLIMGGWLFARVQTLERPEGIIIASGTAEARSGPNMSYPASFTVPEGRHVLILKDQEPISGWLEIGVPQEGLKGWMPDTSIEIIR